jgi:hypothetical protein
MEPVCTGNQSNATTKFQALNADGVPDLSHHRHVPIGVPTAGEILI